MKQMWAFFPLVVGLAACQPAEPSALVANCQSVFAGDAGAQRMLDNYATDSEGVCDCLENVVAALPEDRQAALTGGLAEMVRLKEETGGDMEAVYQGFKSGEHSLDGRPFTIDDLSEMGEMFEDAAENVSEDNVCDVG